MPELSLPEYQWTRLLLQRGLAAIYLVAFLVAARQFRGLLGSRGILPVPAFLERVGFRRRPSLFHFRYSDGLAVVLAWAGAALSLAALVGLPEALGTPASAATWALLWLLYLSFVNVGQVFYGYGWESLLLEAGFLAVFLGGAGVEAPAVVIWLFRWLLFRVMLGAGLIKLRGDECWRKLTCLDHHYETQPLPNPLSWWLHRSPTWLNRTGVAFTHFVQLAVPFAYLVPGPVSWVAGGLTILFQGTLILSGNLSWLNWLTAVLAVACFADPALAGVLPAGVGGDAWWAFVYPDGAGAAARALPHEAAVWGVALLVAVKSVEPVRNLFSEGQRMNASFDPLHLVNTYGAFGSVTRKRFEVVVEGTRAERPGADAEWRAFTFPGKPGDPGRRPPVVSPYHWRLDWQMWFLPLRPGRRPRWFLAFVRRLLEAEPVVRGLLAGDPFGDDPPRWIRARLFRYEFTDPGERAGSGRWWRRRPVGEYLPAVSLEPESGGGAPRLRRSPH